MPLDGNIFSLCALRQSFVALDASGKMLSADFARTLALYRLTHANAVLPHLQKVMVFVRIPKSFRSASPMPLFPDRLPVR